MKNFILVFFAFFSISHCFAQIQIVNEKIIPCSIQPNVIALSPDGNTLIVGGNGKKLRLYDVVSGAELPPLAVKDVFAINDVKFSPDGKTFAAAGDDHVVIFDTRTFNSIFEFQSKNGLVTSISFSPDSKKLVAAYKNSSSILDLTTFSSTYLGNSDNEFKKVIWCSSKPIIAFANSDERITAYLRKLNGKSNSPGSRSILKNSLIISNQS